MAAPDLATQRYLQTHVRSRTPLELVVMLYDGALRHVTAAAEAVERRDIGARREGISRALSMIAELQNSLNLEQGGAIAAELDRLYAWMVSRLADATIHQNAQPIVEVRRILEILRDSWSQIAASGPGATESAT